MKKSKVVFLIAMLVVLIPALAIAGGNQPARAAGDKSLSLISVPAGAPFPDGVSIMNSEFFDLIQQKSGFTLNWELFRAGVPNDEQITLLMASGNPPNMIQGASTALIGRFAREGGLASFDTALPNYPFLSKLYTREIMGAFSIDGKMYALPRVGAFNPATTLAIRKDWLRELNIAEPKTTDELYAALKAVKAAKPNVIPLVIGNNFGTISALLGAFGIPNERGPSIIIENGRASFPYLDNRIVDFIRYMNRLYVEGLIDPEFLIDTQAIQKMIAGNGFVMDINYVDIVRQMPAFKDRNPGGILEYFDPPRGPSGAVGNIRQRGLGGVSWIVPAAHNSKVPLVLELLELVNSNTDFLDIFAMGIVGRDVIKNPDGTLTRTDNFARVAGTKGYYSRLDITGHFDSVNNILEGFDVPLDFLAKTTMLNDIVYAPINVPEDAALIPTINQITSDAVYNMIINGYSDAAFNRMKQDLNNAGLERVLAQYQAWYSRR